MALQVEIVTTEDRFQAIRTPWDRLWCKTVGDVFRSHGWLSAWLAGGGRAVTPHVVLAWRGDELVAAFPLAVRRHWGLRLLEWCAQAFSDYCDVLVLPEIVPRLPTIWDIVWQAGGFDLLNLRHIRPDAAIGRCLGPPPDRSVRMRGNRRVRTVSIDCVYPSGEAWFRSLGKKGRNNVWRGERLLTGLGGEIAYRCLDPALHSVDAEMKWLFEVKQEWARARKRSSLLLRADGRAMEAMLRAAAQSGRMRLFVLTSGGSIAAASVNFLQGDSLQAYMTGYDPAFERASPGMLLIVHYVRWAYDQGLATVDLLRGREPFKLRLATSGTALNSYDTARTLLGRVANALHNGSRHLRDLVRRDGKAVDFNPEPPPVAAMLRE